MRANLLLEALDHRSNGRRSEHCFGHVAGTLVPNSIVPGMPARVAAIRRSGQRQLLRTAGGMLHLRCIWMATGF